MFRSLLAALKPAASQEFVVDFAAALAGDYRLVVDGRAVIDVSRVAPGEPVPLGAGAFKAERDEQLLRQARSHAEHVIAQLSAACRARKVACEAQVVDGETVATLAAESQRSDLVVCGHTPGGDSGERSLLYAILRACPRPAIIVPQAAFSGRDVLVAYDGSFQAGRALASFADSGLGAGRSVTVVSFDGTEGPADRRAATAVAFLRRHEIAATPRVVPASMSVGDQLLEEADRIAAGLVVMGAMGKSAFREFFLGSVTRSVLDNLARPVLLDH